MIISIVCSPINAGVGLPGLDWSTGVEIRDGEASRNTVRSKMWARDNWRVASRSSLLNGGDDRPRLGEIHKRGLGVRASGTSVLPYRNRTG